MRAIADKFDVVGNVTKANAKGYSVGTASLACFLLFVAFVDEINFISEVKLVHINIKIPEVFLSDLLGSTTVFIFTNWAILIVGNAA